MNPEQGLEGTSSLTTILLPRSANNAGATTVKNDPSLTQLKKREILTLDGTK